MSLRLKPIADPQAKQAPKPAIKPVQIIVQGGKLILQSEDAKPWN
ncbi:MAG: hypothetical protein U0798_19565 [Gemmataceae bacterium]